MKTSLLDQFILLETPQRGSKRWGFFVSLRAQNVYNPAKRRIEQTQISRRASSGPRSVNNRQIVGIAAPRRTLPPGVRSPGKSHMHGEKSPNRK